MNSFVREKARLKKLLFIILCLVILPQFASADLKVYFLDVGQGDSAIITCDGETMIIDGGLPGASDTVFTYIKNELSLDHIDYMVATHPDDDHVGGLPAVYNAVNRVDYLLTPVKELEGSNRLKMLIDKANENGTIIKIPYEEDTYFLGGATVEILHCWPEAGLKRKNDMSICLRIDYGETSFLFMGDAEEYSEDMMIAANYLLEADVIKISHHGSSGSSSLRFLEAVNPKYAVISCGKNNAYGHPNQDTLNTLKNKSIELYRTDLQGTIICTSDGRTIQFSTKRSTQEDLFLAPGNK